MSRERVCDRTLPAARRERFAAAVVFAVLVGLVCAGSAAAQGLGGSSVLALDGGNDYATAPDGAAFDVGNGADDDFTLETRFHITNPTAVQTGTLFFKTSSYGLYILFNASGDTDRIIFRLYTIGTSYVYSYAEVTLADGWHHIAAVFDNENTESSDLAAIYLDGVLAASSTGVDWSPGVPNTGNPLSVGGSSGINGFPGWLDEARISGSARYSGPSYIVPTSAFTTDVATRALWHFDDTPGTTSFSDSSGGGNTLTGMNGAATHNDDVTAPVVTLVATPAAPDGLNGWYRTKPLLAVTSSEPGPCFYRVGAAAPQDYTGEVTVPNGSWTYWGWARDAAGNVAAEQSVSFKVDSYVPKAGLTAKSFYRSRPGTWVAAKMYEFKTMSVKATLRVKKYGTTRYIRTLWSNASKTASASGYTNKVYWNGKSGSGVLVPKGRYVLVLKLTDPAGNSKTVSRTASVL